MSIYHNLEQTKLVACEYAKNHNCNYNIIIMNPDVSGNFSLDNGSTYEMVIDSYFEKPRPNAKLLFKTDDLLKEEVDAEDKDIATKFPDDIYAQNEIMPVFKFYRTPPVKIFIDLRNNNGKRRKR